MNFSRLTFCALSAFLVCLNACGDDSNSQSPQKDSLAEGDERPAELSSSDAFANVSLSSAGGTPADIQSLENSSAVNPLNPISSGDPSFSSTNPADTSGALIVDPLSSASQPNSAESPKSSAAESTPDNPIDNPAPESSAPEPGSSTSEPVSSAAEPALNFDFLLGADISTVQEQEAQNTKFFDVDGTEGDIFTILKKHGFNAIRLRTFVSPLANYGYAAKSSECNHSGSEAFGDKEHVIAYGKKVKAAGMVFLLDIHYSDNWADPGKQIIPERWRNVTSSDAMADSVYNYTYDLLTSFKAAGALPEMVQVGNETTPGILIHKPSGSTDCWGNNPDKASTAINGDMGTDAGKANAAKYFNAGIKAVKAVSQDIKTVLHIERIRKPETVNWWMGVVFDQYKIPADVMGFSAYTAYGDGAPTSWLTLFNSLNSKYPKLEFIVAEYNGGDSDNHYNYDGSRKKTNEVIRGLDRWIGTFFWEPTLGGAWGPAMFDWSGNNLKANAKAFEEFD
ncbi:glycosyl hydrolase 53 family protein [Fibrobacter sp.]|uniref:glycosyl hydrolase 53 family protein n=1 Tax=Fibrobacter sp. TaxID=35828 RepID=UPI00388D3BDC